MLRFHEYPNCPRVSRMLNSEMIDTSPSLVGPSFLTEGTVDTVGGQAGTDYEHHSPEPKPSPPTNGPRAAPTDSDLNEHNHHDIFTNVKHNTRRRRGTDGGRGGNQHVRGRGERPRAKTKMGAWCDRCSSFWLKGCFERWASVNRSRRNVIAVF